MGLGALGTVAADQIVRSGVGFVRIVDRDFVKTTSPATFPRPLLLKED
jgi:molybdopterin-synthase adenylyltransferase